MGPIGFDGLYDGSLGPDRLRQGLRLSRMVVCPRSFSPGLGTQGAVRVAKIRDSYNTDTRSIRVGSTNLNVSNSQIREFAKSRNAV